MKKHILLVLVLTLALALGACGKDSAQSGDFSIPSSDVDVVDLLIEEVNTLVAAGRTDAAKLVMEQAAATLAERAGDPEAFYMAEYYNMLSEEARQLMESYDLAIAINASDTPTPEIPSIPDTSFVWGD